LSILTNDEYFVRDVRLPRHVVPDHYDLELQPIIKEENFTTFGSVVLTFTVSEEETLTVNGNQTAVAIPRLAAKLYKPQLECSATLFLLTFDPYPSQTE
jgi:hypothetical protein